MGRKCGYLAVMAGITTGAEAVLIPEVKFDLEAIIDKIKLRYQKQSKSRSIVIVAEGVGSAYDFGKAFALIGGFDTRITVLGHLQRGGSPTHFDRYLASRMGVSAVRMLREGKHGVMVGLQNNAMVDVPLNEALSNKKQLSPELLKMFEVLA
jgi:6-phosphofructokinase 1